MLQNLDKGLKTDFLTRQVINMSILNGKEHIMSGI
jgi:hypothetical protein